MSHDWRRIALPLARRSTPPAYDCTMAGRLVAMGANVAALSPRWRRCNWRSG